MPDTQDPRRVRIRIQDNQARTIYANAFRQHATAQELIVDLGINTVIAGPGQDAHDESSAEMLFHVDARLVMNYETARRLAGQLTQLIQQHDRRASAPARQTPSPTMPGATNTPATEPAVPQ